MRSEIDVFDVKCEIDDIPYQYLRFFVRIVICIVGKLSICNKFLIEEKKSVDPFHKWLPIINSF